MNNKITLLVFITSLYTCSLIGMNPLPKIITKRTAAQAGQDKVSADKKQIVETPRTQHDPNFTTIEEIRKLQLQQQAAIQNIATKIKNISDAEKALEQIKLKLAEIDATIVSIKTELKQK